MLQKMRQWGIDETAQGRIMQNLTENGFVDDERYCRLYIDDKLKYNQWGRKKIEQGLIMKGVDRKIYQPMLSAVDSDVFADILRPLLDSKRRTTKAASPYEMKMKLIRFALSRGFEMREINMCIDETGFDDDF